MMFCQHHPQSSGIASARDAVILQVLRHRRKVHANVVGYDVERSSNRQHGEQILYGSIEGERRMTADAAQIRQIPTSSDEAGEVEESSMCYHDTLRFSCRTRGEHHVGQICAKRSFVDGVSRCRGGWRGEGRFENLTPPCFRPFCVNRDESQSRLQDADDLYHPFLRARCRQTNEGRVSIALSVWFFCFPFSVMLFSFPLSVGLFCLPLFVQLFCI